MYLLTSSLHNWQIQLSGVICWVQGSVIFVVLLCPSESLGGYIFNFSWLFTERTHICTCSSFVHFRSELSSVVTFFAPQATHDKF